MPITYSKVKTIEATVLFDLFQRVGWIAPKCDKPSRHRKIDGISNHTIYLDSPSEADILRQAFENSDAIFVARFDEKIVGFVRVISDRLQRSALYDLIVDPDFQKQGIGSQLVQLCLCEYKATQITLGTSTPTMGFYERLGFLRSHNYLELATEAY